MAHRQFQWKIGVNWLLNIDYAKYTFKTFTVDEITIAYQIKSIT
jgi:hypothetical protein